MSENEIDKQGCLGVALMVIGAFCLLMGIISGHEGISYLGSLIPIGYLIKGN